METIETRLVLVIFTYSSIISTKGVDVGYTTNKWTMQVPYEEIAIKEVYWIQNMTYKKPVSIDFQETLQSWSYRDRIHPSYVYPKDLKSSSNYRKAFNDEQWSDMWYVQDYRTDRSQSVLDMNVVPVYFNLGITGKYVNVSIVDDELDWKHPELESHYSPDLSYNYIDDSYDILPDYNGKPDSHGTKSAGLIMMQPNNKLCGVGIAYGATFGGIQVLSGSTTLIAKALGHADKYMDVYSNSWGNSDEGNHTISLNEYVDRMFSWITTHGRNGKGSVYVFAGGNGKKDGDHCSCDGYVNSIHTISVAACNHNGHPTYYSERCAAIMVTSYSGEGDQKGLLTTDLNKQCTVHYSGTSAATPIVSGVVTLALSMNPNLTWRDIMHLIVWTSQVAPLSDNLGWNKNKAGFYYSVDFGFGLINAYKLVRMAKIWRNVPKMNTCGIRMPSLKNTEVTRNSGTRIIVKTNGCKGLSNEVKFIEQIQLVLAMDYSKRGDIQIAMKSPAGTDVMVLESRFKDYGTQLERHEFLVLAFWGESPRGQFVIDIFDKTGESSNSGYISDIALVIYGTEEAPKIYNKGPRPYDNFKLASRGQSPIFNQLSTKKNGYNQGSYKKKYGNGYINDSQYYSNYNYGQNYNGYYSSYNYNNNMYYNTHNRPLYSY